MTTRYQFSDVLRLSGATRSQLIYWSDRRWLPSLVGTTKRGPGNRNEFTPEDVVAARVAAEAQRKYGRSAPALVLARWGKTPATTEILAVLHST